MELVAKLVLSSSGGEMLFESLSAEDFYSLGKINRASSLWLRDFSRTHASFARKCMAVHPSDPRWEGLTRSVMERMLRLPNTVTSLNLLGCVSPTSFRLLEDSNRHWNLSAAPRVLLGALPGDDRLLYGLLQLPTKPLLGNVTHYIFHQTLRLHVDSDSSDADEEGEGDRRAAVFVYKNCWSSANTLFGFDLDTNVALRDADVPDDFATGEHSLFVNCVLRNANEASGVYATMTYDPPFTPRAFPNVKTLVVKDVFPDNFNEIGKSLTSLDFVGQMLDLNPQIRTLSMIQDGLMSLTTLQFNPPAIFGERTGLNACPDAHRHVHAAWTHILRWSKAKENRTLKMLLTEYYNRPVENRSRCFTYGVGDWGIERLTPL